MGYWFLSVSSILASVLLFRESLLKKLNFKMLEIL